MKYDKNAWNEIDSPPLSQDILNRMKPVKESHPGIPSRVRGPQKTPKKVPISIRLSPQVIQYFKSLGQGWQGQLDEVLKDYVKSHEQ